MNALVRKEIRLLLPAWIAAMLLIVVPVPLYGLFEDSHPAEAILTITWYATAAACILLGLTSFGREFSSGTFSLLLGQPRRREELWRAKVGVLLFSLIPLLLFLSLVSQNFAPAFGGAETVLIWLVTVCVAITGGLWTTLLFRQIVAAFWISALVPVGILASVLTLDDQVAGEKTRNFIAIALLLAYSVAGYLFARWQFRHAQDTAWTGGNVSLPGIQRWWPWRRAETARQKMHPLRALLGKEFQFQQMSFMLAGLLLLVQIAVLLLQKFMNLNENSVLAMIVQGFWGIWIIMPLLVGCGAVAEERKLGTLEPQLCLPVSRAWQFAVKAFVTLICGTVLGALVPILVSILNPSREAHTLEFAASWTLACVCVAFVSLYASSLTQQLLQAVGAAIGLLVIGFFLSHWFVGDFSRGNGYFSLFGAPLWRGPLVLVVGARVTFLFAMGHTWRRLRWVWATLLALIAVALFLGGIQSLFSGGLSNESQGVFSSITVIGMVAALCPVALILALAAKNFTHIQTSASLRRRNAATWLGCFAITGVLTALVYNRVWELTMPFEPPAGAPRLSGSVSPIVTRTFFDHPVFVLLPDGRLWSFRTYEQIPPSFAQNSADETANPDRNWRPTKHPQVECVDGSNWVSVATTIYDFAGVQADGSLWRVAWFERVDKEGHVTPIYTGSPGEKNGSRRAAVLRPERFEIEGNWAEIAASSYHYVARKHDGTIWGWGYSLNQEFGAGPKFTTNAPVQIGQATNWNAVYAGTGRSYAVNNQGEIWKWGKSITDPSQRKIEEGPVKLNLKVSGVRGVIAGDNDFDLVIDGDGNLWGLGRIPPALRGGGVGMQYFSEPLRLDGLNWMTINCSWAALVGLKNDGTIWSQHSRDPYNEPLTALTQLGSRTDWIAVNPEWGADLALAKDGTLCRFGEPTSDSRRLELLAPTRRVTWSLNLLDATK